MSMWKHALACLQIVLPRSRRNAVQLSEADHTPTNLRLSTTEYAHVTETYICSGANGDAPRTKTDHKSGDEDSTTTMRHWCRCTPRLLYHLSTSRARRRSLNEVTLSCLGTPHYNECQSTSLLCAQRRCAPGGDRSERCRLRSRTVMTSVYPRCAPPQGAERSIHNACTLHIYHSEPENTM